MMNNDIFFYLTEVSISIAFIACFYKFLFEKLTFFGWNRWYILGGLTLAIVLPLSSGFYTTQLSVFYRQHAVDTIMFNLQMPSLVRESTLTGNVKFVKVDYSILWRNGLFWILILIYVSGCCYKTYFFLKGLKLVASIKKGASLVETGVGYSVYTQNALPSFSFRSNIFLHRGTNALTTQEVGLIKRHELGHVLQKHTWDILFMESASIFFWFNPFLSYLSKSLRALHEYQADAFASVDDVERIYYGKLIIKLATMNRRLPLIHTFSDSQIFNRIKMLTITKSSSMQKLRFFCALPVIALMVVVCSCLGTKSDVSDEFSGKSLDGKVFKASDLKIGEISWEGNRKYTDEQLNQILSVKSGDVYDSTRISDALFGGLKTNRKDIIALYMDQGYLFYRIEPKTKINGNIVDISFEVFEGSMAKIGKINFVGNNKAASRELLEKIETKSGELFSRAKLINSQRILANSGKFDPKDIQINPAPDLKSTDKDGIINVDIEFRVKEI